MKNKKCKIKWKWKPTRLYVTFSVCFELFPNYAHREESIAQAKAHLFRKHSRKFLNRMHGLLQLRLKRAVNIRFYTMAQNPLPRILLQTAFNICLQLRDKTFIAKLSSNIRRTTSEFRSWVGLVCFKKLEYRLSSMFVLYSPRTTRVFAFTLITSGRVGSFCRGDKSHWKLLKTLTTFATNLPRWGLKFHGEIPARESATVAL